VYPKPLPNLYKGQQMIIAGRYDAPGSATATFSGETFGKPVSYTYTSLLTGDQIVKYQFLMKIWAKRKMEYLLGIYYQQDPNSPVAKELKSEITRLCMKYSIVGPFTSFVDNGQTTPLEKISEKKPVQKSFIRILALSQNTIQFIVENSVQCPSHVHIYNSKGQLVRTLMIMIHGKGVYSVRWDGLFENGTSAPCDVYFCVIEIQESKLCGKMVFLR
jgi:Ca-activated chloride channel family protein